MTFVADSRIRSRIMAAMSPRPAPTSRGLALGLAFGLAMVTGACAGPREATSSPTTHLAGPFTTSPSPEQGHGSHEGGPEVGAYLALCDMAAQVEAGDLDRAEATFHDEVHEPLHELADRLETTDRAASAALLVAKTRVEEDLARDPMDAGALGKDVWGLLRAMADALEAAGDAPPACLAGGAA